MAWFYGILLFSNSSRGMRSSFLRKQLGIGVKSAHRLCNSIRAHIAYYERPEQLGGVGKNVYVDEALIKYLSPSSDYQGRNAIVMGIACEGEILCGVIDNRKQETIIASIDRFVRPGSRIITDCHASYHTLPSRGWEHTTVNHSRAFHNFHGVTTNEIEVYWSVLKRTLRAYRQVGRPNLWRFLAEIEYSYNRRHSTLPRFAELMSSFPEITPASLKTVRDRYVWSYGSPTLNQ